MQGSVPVIVAHHSTTSPLETEGKIKSLNSSRGYKGHYRMTIKLDKKKNSNTCTLHSTYFSFNVDVCNIPLPVWCSMHPSGRRCYPCCTAPALLSGPVWRFRSPGQTEVQRWIMGYVGTLAHNGRRSLLYMNVDLHRLTLSV